MNAHEHYCASEEALRRAETSLSTSSNLLLAAQVHALLALASGGAGDAVRQNIMRPVPSPPSRRRSAS